MEDASKLQIHKLRKKMKKVLDQRRYEHTLGVMYTASALAMRYEVDIAKAMTAGLLHDCAKCIPNEEKYRLCSLYGIMLSETEYMNPELIHAKLGAFLSKEWYHVSDMEIRNAIKNHTTGCDNMTLLDKIIFVADYVEPYRKFDSDITALRSLAFQDIDQAFVVMLEESLMYLKKNCKAIDPMTEATYLHYKTLQED